METAVDIEESRSLRGRIADLEARLREAQETLDAIRLGEVDAVIVGGPDEQRVYTIENADRPYRVLIEQMQEGAVTLAGDGTILYCNRHFTRLVTTPQERVTGTSFPDFLPPVQRPAFDRLIGESASGGGKGEFSLRQSDGSTVPVYLSFVDLADADGRVLCGIVTDLTRHTQQRVTEEGFQVALQASEMGSWDLDLATDTASRSPRHDQIFGHDPQGRWGRSVFLGHVVPADRQAVEDAFTMAAETGALELECAIERADDRAFRWIRIKGRTYFDGGRPARMVGVVADITEQRQLEDQLRQAQKMEAVGQLTGGLAHDFNNLLTVILGNLEQARRQTADERLSRQIDQARQAAERGAGLTQQLLAFSRRQSLQPRVLCVKDLLPGLAQLIQRVIGDDIELQLHEESALWHCEVDPNQLESALLNLSINARDAMPDGGSLTIRTANALLSEKDTADMPGLSPGRFVRISVSDTGEGMSPEVQARVFEPFFTTKEIGKGSGLGLSMVYGFVRQSNGHVAIESRVGTGTDIHLYIPGASALPAEKQPPASPAAPSSRTATVLVVEDDPDLRRLVVQMVAGLGHTVFQADSGPEALAVLEAQPAIELLFTDIVMPKGMSGIDLAREARRRRPRIAVLLTSGFTMQSLSEREGSDRLFRLVRKPYRQDELSQAISASLLEPQDGEAPDAGSPLPPPAALRVLVVEDEPLISMVLEDYLADLGCEVVGPCATLGAALAAAEAEGFDVALLDVNIGHATAYPVAERLQAAAVPFAFMTGHDAGSLPAPYRGTRHLAKPYSGDDVKRVVDALRSDIAGTAA